jgi:uncharacterized membrane protein YbhN (UPF0104 family)
MKSQTRILRLLLTIFVFLLFGYYFFRNRSDFSRLADIPLPYLLFILLGQLLVVVSNVGILIVLVRIASRRIATLPATRVIAYSSVINFFGFLQGGLGFRGIYLKKYLNISLKTYSLLTLLQYAVLFGLTGFIISLGFLMIYPEYAWLVLPGVAAAIALGGLIFYGSRFHKIPTLHKLEGVRPLALKHKGDIGLLLLFAILQLAGSFMAYGFELHALGAEFSLSGLLIFAGLAQFSILFALTPGAIGIREALLLLVAEQIHLTTQTVILSATIDRLVYFVTLACLLPFYFSVKDRAVSKE